MTHKKLYDKISIRQILMHSTASAFFMLAFAILSYLHNIKMVEALREMNLQEASNRKIISSLDISNYFQWCAYSMFGGLLIAFIISLSISIHRRWFWANSLVAFIGMFLMGRLVFLSWVYSRKVLFTPGQASTNTSADIILRGAALLLIGFLIFFMPAINRFIEKGKGVIS